MVSAPFVALEWQSFVLCRLGIPRVFAVVWDASFPLL